MTEGHALPELKECSFSIACDVVTPLCGAKGCSAVYGPQKGADETMIPQMDQWLYNYANLTEKVFQHADRNYPGAAADAALCNEAGIDAFFPIVRSAVSLEEAMDKENARKNMADTAEQVFRLIRVFFAD